jgi:superfamily II DNA or RNA helicase/HKD family nuclease
MPSFTENDTPSLAYGLYDALIDQKLKNVLVNHPDLRSVLGKIDPEEQPSRCAAFVANVIEQALKQETEPAERLEICNRLINQLATLPNRTFLAEHKLVSDKKTVLLEITPPNYVGGIPRPETSVTQSSLFTGSPREPQLVYELQQEMKSADEVDILISFIKWSGLRLLMQALEDLRIRNIPVRVITTSYMGASDAPAVEWLAGLPNVDVRVSYDTQRTRLHAKAYHFRRRTGFSTAYIGSANMSHAAMTSGLEWNLKVTAQDMPHILEKFSAEFATYWNSREFVSFDTANPMLFREAIQHARNPNRLVAEAFFDLRPHPFQERILEALEVERSTHNRWRNLIIAATGTGKTVIAAFDFCDYFEKKNRQARLLFVAHRREILEQALGTFRNVLRRSDFGELLVGHYEATRMEHLFCSIDMLSNRRLWEQVGNTFYDYIVIDEVHHGPANSYRPIFDQFNPQILLGLTATPERMDGKSVAADFGNRFAAEIRLPEALEEKLLCPFHYFGIADPISLVADKFWVNGKYDVDELEKIYTGAHIQAKQRLDAIYSALLRYEPDLSRVKGIGFCVSVNHAEFMASMFNKLGIKSAVLTGDTNDTVRSSLLCDLRDGKITILFTRDVLNEGLDIREINTVLFLRPTESLTVFLQQLGRGLRHSPEKDCLTVLDFVGQAHKNYRVDSKLKALLPKARFQINREVELEFPHLPAGCSIQLDRIAREYILKNIQDNLHNLAIQIPERLGTFEHETGLPLTFANFVQYHQYEPEQLLIKETWSGWKSKANLEKVPTDPDILKLKRALLRIASVTGPKEIHHLLSVITELRKGNTDAAMAISGKSSMALHYRIWAADGGQLGIEELKDSFQQLVANPSILSDMNEILEWALAETRISGLVPELPFPCTFELHAQYSSVDIQAILGLATLSSAGQRGVGLFHHSGFKVYSLLITFQKTEREFSPTTMYADYPISRELLHWESQSNTTQSSNTGLNLIQHSIKGYTVLVFARDVIKRNGIATPYTYLGPVDCVSYEGERPIKMVWRLRHPMPVEMFEENRQGG